MSLSHCCPFPFPFPNPITRIRRFSLIVIVINVVCLVSLPILVSAAAESSDGIESSSTNELLRTFKVAREARLKNQPINMINININNNDEHTNDNTNISNNEKTAIIFPAEVDIWDFQTTPPPPQQTIGQVTQLSSAVGAVELSLNEDESKGHTPFTDLVQQLAQ